MEVVVVVAVGSGVCRPKQRCALSAGSGYGAGAAGVGGVLVLDC